MLSARKSQYFWYFFAIRFFWYLFPVLFAVRDAGGPLQLVPCQSNARGCDIVLMSLRGCDMIQTMERAGMLVVSSAMEQIRSTAALWLLPGGMEPRALGGPTDGAGQGAARRPPAGSRWPHGGPWCLPALAGALGPSARFGVVLAHLRGPGRGDLRHRQRREAGCWSGTIEKRATLSLWVALALILCVKVADSSVKGFDVVNSFSRFAQVEIT